MALQSTHQDEGLVTEVALLPTGSPFATLVREAARAVGADFVRTDLSSPQALDGRILVLDLSQSFARAPLGPRVIAISTRQDLDCYDVITPTQVRVRLQRALRNLVERERLEARLAQERDQIDVLNELGYALSAQGSQASLLDAVLTHARRLAKADGGSIYLVEDERLRFVCSQNDTLPYRASRTELPLAPTSLPGLVAVRGEPLNIADAYLIPEDEPFRPDFSFDKETGYRSRSLLLMPLKDREGTLLGVILLVNHKPRAGQPLGSFDQVTAFSEYDEAVVRSVASQAAVAIQNWRLFHNIRELFHGFVNAAVTAIEARDPSTGGHSHRVAELTVRMAKALDTVPSGRFADVHFSERDLTELHYASMLHDFGKVGVREEVLLKADKLYPWELSGIEYRFRLAGLQVTLETVQQSMEDGRPDQTLAQLRDDLAFVRYLNKPGKGPTDREVERLHRIRRQWTLPELGEPVINERHVSRLCIPYGSLDPDERLEIQAHVTHTYNFLKAIPWTPDLKRVPDLAHAHHEKLNGKGYPRGLVGDEIPLGARVMTIADIFDALTAGDRPYRAGLTPFRALSILREEARGGRVESEVVELFAARRLWEGVLDKFPAQTPT